MIIVEFVGLSGCGKSTLCKRVQKELRKKDISSVTLQKTIKTTALIDKVIHFIELKKSLSSNENQRFKDVINYAFAKSGDDKSGSFSYWMEKMCILNSDRIKAEQRKIKVGLIDEGCVQFISSVLQKRRADERLVPVIEALKNELYRERTVFVNCELEPETCFERMKARGRYAGGVDGDSIETTVKNLNIRRNNLDYLLSQIEKDAIISVRMDGDDNIDGILNKIYSKLDETKNINE